MIALQHVCPHLRGLRPLLSKEGDLLEELLGDNLSCEFRLLCTVQKHRFAPLEGRNFHREIQLGCCKGQ